MQTKHKVTFQPGTPGGYEGTHHFQTIRERNAFVARAHARGVGNEWIEPSHVVATEKTTTTGNEMIDTDQPVRITAAGLKANPDFKGLVGTVIPASRVNARGIAVFFPERGATSIWLDGEVENVPAKNDRRVP